MLDGVKKTGTVLKELILHWKRQLQKYIWWIFFLCTCPESLHFLSLFVVIFCIICSSFLLLNRRLIYLTPFSWGAELGSGFTYHLHPNVWANSKGKCTGGISHLASEGRDTWNPGVAVVELQSVTWQWLVAVVLLPKKSTQRGWELLPV